MIEIERELRLAKSILSQQGFYVTTTIQPESRTRKEKFIATKKKTLSRQSRGAEGENACRDREIHVVIVFVELVEDSYKTTLSRQEQDCCIKTML